VHPVGLIIEIYYDARLYERQIWIKCFCGVQIFKNAFLINKDDCKSFDCIIRLRYFLSSFARNLPLLS